MIGERIKRARAAAGLSMQALGKQVGVSANMIKKYEHNISMPGSAMFIKLGKALGVRTEYFFRPISVSLSGVEYRKRTNTPAAVLKQIEADVLDQAERWQELANLWPAFPVPAFTGINDVSERITTLEEVEQVADHVRASWQLGLNPLPDLVDVLESHGVLVIITHVNVHAKFDGLQATVADQPVVVVSANWPGDRQRFTLAHELGHLLLYGRMSSELDEEKASDRFAAAFLLPAASIRRQLGGTRHNLEVRELYLLKHEFGLSMMACLHRAAELGIIGKSTSNVVRGRVRRPGAGRLFKVFSSEGWRKQEPGEAYTKEHTLLFQQLVCHALAEGIISESKAAELLKMPLMRFHQIRKLKLFDAITHL